MLTWLMRTFRKKPQMSGADVMRVYGAILERHPGFVMDVSMLPRPKAEMKIMLKYLYGVTSDPRLQSTLTMGFMSLAHFQEGVGADPVDPKVVDDDFPIIGPNPTDQDIENIKRFASESAASGKIERFIFWQDAVAKETSQLEDEWAGFLEGDPI